MACLPSSLGSLLAYRQETYFASDKLTDFKWILTGLATGGMDVELPLDAYYVFSAYGTTSEVHNGEEYVYYGQPAEIRFKLDTESPVTSPIEVKVETGVC